ncbi:MAG: hypothetical protein D6731_09770 [Planctomycetota bacterium]|nr:MAG: hypothetical protein D6731_09770 [Planctomycetota bacterium]
MAFLQDLLVGKVLLDRGDPAHLRSLGAACQLVEDYALVNALLPELSQKLAGLRDDAAGDLEVLRRRRELLEELQAALERRLGELGAAIEAVEAAEAAADEEARAPWPWEDPSARPFEGVVALDLGNTNLVCAFWNFQAEDPSVSSCEPVAVNVLDARGFHALARESYKVGERALRHRNQINLYRSFRRWLGTQHRPRPAITGSQLVPVAVGDLTGAVLKDALERLIAQESPGGAPLRFPQVAVTVPASGDAAYEYELRGVFERLRVGGSAELDEASAAGVYFLLRPVLQRRYMQGAVRLTPGEWYARTFGMPWDGNQGELNALCIDVGGASTDVSLLQLGVLQDSRACRLTVEVLETSSFRDLSGEGLTLYLFDLLKRRLALALSDPGRAVGGKGASEPARHPWTEFHQAEAGNKAPYVPQHLAEDLTHLLANWDLVAGREPLSPELRRVVDTLFPTATRDAPRVGKKIRRVHFETLWAEAERVKREISTARAAGEPLPVRRRLNLKAFKRQAKSVHVDGFVRAAGVDPERPAVPDALGVSSEDIDAFVRERSAGLLSALRRLARGRAVHRVLLAGNGVRDARFYLGEALARIEGIDAERIDFDPAEAKTAVAKGACLWSVGNRLEGVQVTILRRPRHPSTLTLVSAIRNDELFKRGTPINRFAYVQPPAREGDDGSKLVQVDRVVAGQLKPFLMFRPQKDGRPLPDFASLPVARRHDLQVPRADLFLERRVEGTLVDFTCKDPDQYVQVGAHYVSNWEILEKLRKELNMLEAIAWIESRQELAADPPQGYAYHRYYMDENRELNLVYHARGQKLLVPAQVVESARRELPPELDPFSGVH